MFYNKEFLKATLTELNDAVEDLSLWSVHNDDLAQDEIFALKRAAQEVETRLMIEQMKAEEEDNGSEYDQMADYMEI